MEEFIQNWGYVAVLLGSAVEGEIVVMLAGMFARLGQLDLQWVMFIAFWGTLVADQLCFFLGRYYGPAVMNRFPILKYKSRRVFRLLRQYDTWFIMTFRFIYGIRIASPIIIGASQLNPRRFSILNVPAAIIWAIAIPFAGYALGEAINAFLEHLHRIQRYIFMVGLPALIALIVTYRFIRRRKKRLITPQPLGITFGKKKEAPEDASKVTKSD